MNRFIDYESLKNENFQLKNQITDLKNGFDLNRDVLKILGEQNKESHPKMQIFYQIISRLTGINNQIMLSNIDLLQQKCKLSAESKKLQTNIDSLTQRLEELTNSKDCLNPKEIHMEMREQIKQLRSEILALNQECLRKNIQITRLNSIIKKKQNQQQKKPIIASIKQAKKQLTNSQILDIQALPKKHQTKQKLKYMILNKNLQRENNHLKRLVQQLEYRLTLLVRQYEDEPIFNTQKEKFNNKMEEGAPKKTTQNELGLLLFALNNTELEEDPQNQATRLTITKKCKMHMEDDKIITKCSSSIF